jgi:putative phosphoribosyl transferase
MQQAAERTIPIAAGEVILTGDLALPAGAHGLILFAHGSGSRRLSPRNRSVADVLQESRLATLLIDLLTPSEEATDEVPRQLRFDILLLARRLGYAIAGRGMPRPYGIAEPRGTESSLLGLVWAR